MRPLRLLTTGVAAAWLTGCISVLPKAAPEQLYSFGGATTPASAQARQPLFTVEALPITFNRAAAGDRLLTMTGNEAAYIKGARWDVGAQDLFEQALTNAFGADSGPARLMARGEPVKADYFLKLEVRTFEARYLQGQGAAPTVVVTVYAALSRPGTASLAADHLFSASVPAAENRVSAITSAYDQAVTQSLGELVKWVDARGAA
jgi:cholesterol transport system auxiliary component